MIELEEIEREACQATGLADFGSGQWREGMGALADAAVAEGRLNETGFFIPETGQLCLDRNLIVISVLSGGREKGPSFS